VKVQSGIICGEKEILILLGRKSPVNCWKKQAQCVKWWMVHSKNGMLFMYSVYVLTEWPMSLSPILSHIKLWRRQTHVTVTQDVSGNVCLHLDSARHFAYKIPSDHWMHFRHQQIHLLKWPCCGVKNLHVKSFRCYFWGHDTPIS
jgi:hypothetical protein